jgi:hypothetical protein
MNPFDIYITYVSWNDGGKRRPVLVTTVTEEKVSIHPITSKYQTKSETIKAVYYKIVEWKAAGLDTQSYIDTATELTAPRAVFSGSPVGKLSESDKILLLKFLLK